MIITEPQAVAPAATGIRALIRKRPLLAFFSLANGLSWIAWIPYILSLNGIGVWDFRFPAVLGSSQITGVLPGAYLGPITSAALVTAITGGRPGLRLWTGRLLRWRVNWRWYAITLLTVPAGMLITGAVFSAGRVQAPTIATISAYVPLLLLQVITTGLAEEPGWRDFALPRLQRRYGPLRAALLLGPLWGVWHLPLFLSDWGGWPDAHWTRPLTFVGFCIAFNVVMSWVFNRTGESLPLSMLMHVSVNTFASVVWTDMFPSLSTERGLLAMTAAAAFAAGVLLIGTRGRLGYRPSQNRL